MSEYKNSFIINIINVWYCECIKVLNYIVFAIVKKFVCTKIKRSAVSCRIMNILYV